MPSNGTTSTLRAAARQPARRHRPAPKFTTAQRVILAARLSEKGKFSCGKVRWADAADMICVSATYVRRVRRLSEADRARLFHGELSLSRLLIAPAQRPVISRSTVSLRVPAPVAS